MPKSEMTQLSACVGGVEKKERRRGEGGGKVGGDGGRVGGGVEAAHTWRI